MYTEFIKRKFPHDDKLGLYVAPKLPAVKLGKILMKERRISQPGDVVAMFLDEGFFSKTYLLLTETTCFFGKGSFTYEDLRTVHDKGKDLIFTVNNMGSTRDIEFNVGDVHAARALSRVLGDLAYYDPNKKEEDKPDYSAFEGSAVDWLLLRDEVMKTIDLLYERFNDGKLSLLEYEAKKEELLKRL